MRKEGIEMDNKRTTILAFVAIAMMIAVAFVGFVAIADDGSDATDEETNIVSVTIGSVKTEHTNLSEAVETVNSAKTGDVEFKVLKSFSFDTVGAATQAAIWFTYTGGTITVDGDNKTITYNATYGSGQNVMGFASGVNAVVKDLTIDGNKTTDSSTNYAYHGINIYGAKSVNLEKVTVKNVKAAGIIANSENVVMKDCNVSVNCGWGGVNVDIGSRVGGKSNLTIQGTFAGKIWTESLGVSTVTYDGAKITMTMTTKDENKNWKFWYSSTDLSAVVQEAVANADDKDKQAHDFVITLMDDVTLDADKAVSNRAITVTKDMTIDLGGKTLTVNSKSDKAYYNGAINVSTAALTLKNGTVEVPFVKAAQDSVIKVYSQSADKKGQLTTENVTIISGGQNSAYSGYGIFAAAYSNVVVNKGTTITADYAAISGNGSASGATKGTGASITINDGTFTSRKAACVYFPNVDSLTVKGGTFTGATGFEIRAGTIIISGATINVVKGGSLSVADGNTSPLGVAFAVVACTGGYASGTEMSVTIGKNTLNLAENCYAFYLGAPLSEVRYVSSSDVTTAVAIGKSSMTVNYNDLTLSAKDSTSQLASMLINGNGDIIKVGGDIKGVQGTLAFNTEADVVISSATGEITISGSVGNLTLKEGQFSFVELLTTSVKDLKISNVKGLDIFETVTCKGAVEISGVDDIIIFDELIIESGSSLKIDNVDIIASESFTDGQISITTNVDGGFDVSLDKATVSIAAFSVWEKDKLTIGEGSTLTLAGALIDNGTVIVKGKLIASETNYIQIYSGKTLVLNEGAVITGKIVGNDNNSVVVNGLKAGSDGITFTSGSLKINGVIAKDGTTSGVTVKIVSGDNVIISGQLNAGATMEIDEGTTVTIESGKAFSSGGTITNNGTIANNGTVSNSGSIVNNGTVTNVGTLKVTDEATVTGSNIVNSGIVADERSSGTAVPIDTSSTGAVVTESNAKAYDGTGVKVIVEDPETSGTTEGTVTSDSSSYAFVDTITTTGKLNVIMNDGYKQYTITIPKGVTIAATTIISVEYLDFTSDTTKYEITTPGITEFSVKVPVQTGFKSAKVYCDGSTAGVSNVKYSANSGYVTFDAGHNSVFTIVLSNATPSSGTSDAFDEDTAFVGAIVVLVVAILALAVVIKRR